MDHMFTMGVPIDRSVCSRSELDEGHPLLLIAVVFQLVYFKLRSSGPGSVDRSVDCMPLNVENELSQTGTISGTCGGTLQTVFEEEKICSVRRRSKIDGGTLTIVGMKRMRRRGFLCFEHNGCLSTTSGNVVVMIDCGMYQSLDELGVRQIFTFNVESIALVGSFN